MDFGPLLTNIFIIIPLIGVVSLAILISAINILQKDKLNVKDKVYILIISIIFFFFLIKTNYF